MGWQVAYSRGVHLPEIDWWLDSARPVGRSFVSHAHADHAAPHAEILCSEATARLLAARRSGGGPKTVLPYLQPHPIGEGVAATLYPAGHIMGSAQIHLESAAGTLLYSGDFKLRAGYSCEPCLVPRADVLIMETTFGLPRYVLPPAEQVMEEIILFCRESLAHGDVPILFGYSLGRSQELLCGLASAQLPVMMHPRAFKLCRVYEQLGIGFPAYRSFDAADAAGHVVIAPWQRRDSAFLAALPRRRTAVVSGWALDPGAVYRYRCDAAFPLSDHADFPELLAYVEKTGASKVLTLHGFAREFAATLRSRGIEAWALGEENQLEFCLPENAG
jgi:DNA ligase 1